jgi:hypothetical protein
VTPPHRFEAFLGVDSTSTWLDSTIFHGFGEVRAEGIREERLWLCHPGCTQRD